MSDLPPPPAPPTLWSLEVRDLKGELIVNMSDITSFELVGSTWFFTDTDQVRFAVPLGSVFATVEPQQ
jgi:hypothetical protein